MTQVTTPLLAPQYCSRHAMDARSILRMQSVDADADLLNPCSLHHYLLHCCHTTHGMSSACRLQQANWGTPER